MATEHRGGSGNFAEDRQKASEAGQKGGHASSPQHGGTHERDSHQSGGNFAQDHEKAAEAGRKGGHASHGGKN